MIGSKANSPAAFASESESFEGIELTQPLTDRCHDVLHGALLAHHALLFENRPITPRQQRFAGALHIHPV